MARINKVGHVVLRVADVDASVAFYRDALGMEVVRSVERGMAFLSFGTQHHDIALFQDKGDGSRGSNGLAHIAFQIEGGDAELKELHQRLVKVGAPIANITDHGMTHSVYFNDPDGNRLEIFAEVFDPVEGLEWMKANGGVASPLDIGAVATK